jgi:hypothetical protein
LISNYSIDAVPNQRDPDKRRVYFWLSKANKSKLQTAAERRGISVTQLFEELIADEVERQDKPKPKTKPKARRRANATAKANK